jgi:hypothetical protein
MHKKISTALKQEHIWNFTAEAQRTLSEECYQINLSALCVFAVNLNLLLSLQRLPGYFREGGRRGDIFKIGHHFDECRPIRGHRLFERR